MKLADIMVAPEYGIQSLNMKANGVNASAMVEFTQYVPSASDGIIPCQLEDDASKMDASYIEI